MKKRNNTDELFDLFKDNCPEPVGQDDFSKRVNARLYPSSSNKTPGKVLVDFLLSPIPVLIAGIVAIVLCRDFATGMIQKFNLSEPLNQFMNQNFAFPLIVLAISAVIIAVVILWQKLLKDDYSNIDISEIRHFNK